MEEKTIIISFLVGDLENVIAKFNHLANLAINYKVLSIENKSQSIRKICVFLPEHIYCKVGKKIASNIGECIYSVQLLTDSDVCVFAYKN